MAYATDAQKRQWWLEHPNYQKEWHRNHPGRRAEYDKERDQFKVNARRLLNKAVQKGEVIRPEVCSQCGHALPLVGHHPDYSKPLEVEWVCRDCHRNVKH